MKKISTIIGGIAAVGAILAFLLFKNSDVGFNFVLIMLIAQAITESCEYKQTKEKIHLITPVLAIIACIVFVATQMLS